LDAETHKYRIDIALAPLEVEVDLDRLKAAVERTLSLEEIHEADISVAVIGNEEIHELNRQFLDHDYATDVLSFLLEETPGATVENPGDASPLGRGKTISGEVVVSAEMAADRAAEFGWAAEDELLLYLVHGLLHLCGYDDHDDADRELMRQREREVLATWNIVSRETGMESEAKG